MRGHRRSDHGAQHGSRAFAGLCDQLGVTRSMGAVDTSADNAACEGFHASLKRETLQGAHDHGAAASCRRTVFAWLTRYNTRRRHSANGHLSPNAYERRHHTAELTLVAGGHPARGSPQAGMAVPTQPWSGWPVSARRIACVISGRVAGTGEQ
ncbi:integrase core domain-containing protein [Streptomyces sp. XY332]|uniref:integrase core domain-containing protein n=1 Tax=Streptomyces sp. XY332 TaxID=1415561 RepID=UPI000D14BE31|nr:integrase core domain-containing protein [Streptomyces sp. XY332]